jgi:Holliday junction resolvasome RuvABC endonuclease subunit
MAYPIAATEHHPSLKKPRKAVAATKRKPEIVGVPLAVPARLDRIEATVSHVKALLRPYPVGIAVMERMYVDRATDDLLERAWAWGIVARTFWRAGVPLALIPPSTLKAYATGDSQADKKAMLAAAREAWPYVEIEDHNAADGLWLAAAGARRLGRPIDKVSHAQVLALGGGEWPRIPPADGSDGEGEWPELVSDDGEPGAEVGAA